MKRSPLAPESFPELPPVPGVRLAVTRAGYKGWDRADLTFAALDEGTTVAGVTTKSRCPSPEVDWCRTALPLGRARALVVNAGNRSEEHTSELQSLMRISYAVFCLKKKN